MSNIKDFTSKNRVFSGTDGIIPSDTTSSSTANRVDTKGRFRFNASTNLMEYYTGTEWKAVDAPPVINTFNLDGGGDVTSTFVDSTQSGNATIVLKGSLFDASSAVVTLVATSGSDITPATTTINSSSQITLTVPYSDFVNANEPYSFKVLNPSGLFATALSLTVDRAPTFINAVDTTYGIFESTRTGVSIPAANFCGATDPDGDTITYSVSVGALPSGLSLDTTNGNITGTTSTVGSDVTTTFTVAAATTDRTITRQFKITQYAPVTTSYTTTHAGGAGSLTTSFSVPVGLSAVEVLVVGGGAGGTANHAGGGGAGGLIYHPSFPVTPGGSVPIVVGDGSDGHRNAQHVPEPLFKGRDSNFGTLVAKGGGPSHNDSSGSNWSPRNGATGSQNAPGLPGGSGGGGGSQNGPPSEAPGGSADQPGQPGDSGTYGFGNSGGPGWGPPPTPAHTGGGGGGAGSAGSTSGSGGSGGGAGGQGRAYNISGSSVYYAAGGGGGSHSGVGAGGGTGGGGNGNPQPHTAAPNAPNSTGNAGQDDRGSGGGGGSTGSPPVPSSKYRGGTGIVIVKYQKP